MSAYSMLTMAGAALALSGCAAIDGTRPEDMTVPEHERASRAEERRAEEASARSAVVGSGAESERYAAARHRRLAEKHSAAAAHRRAGVAASCEGVGVATPLVATRIERIDAIREASSPVQVQKARAYFPKRLKGARLTVTSPPGEGAAIARAIVCEAAREAADLAASGEARSPLTVRGARVTAAAAGSVAVVDVRTDEEHDAEEILRRARRLAARSTCSAAAQAAPGG